MCNKDAKRTEHEKQEILYSYNTNQAHCSTERRQEKEGTKGNEKEKNRRRVAFSLPATACCLLQHRIYIPTCGMLKVRQALFSSGALAFTLGTVGHACIQNASQAEPGEKPSQANEGLINMLYVRT